MFDVKSVNLLCLLLNTSTSHSRHKIPLSALCNIHKGCEVLIVSVIMRVLMRLVLLKSRSLFLFVFGLLVRWQAGEREKGWTQDGYGGPACTRRGAGWGGRRAHMW
jgi:hypothetical protein